MSCVCGFPADHWHRKPLIMNRSFTLVATCPLGHVADHWLGDTTTIDDRPYIERTCRLETCDWAWLELT